MVEVHMKKSDHLQEMQLQELHLEQFRATGIDDDIENAKERWRELIRDHQLIHIGWNRFKQDLRWGNWQKEDFVGYHAKIVSALRGCYFPMLPEETGN